MGTTQKKDNCGFSKSITPASLHGVSPSPPWITTMVSLHHLPGSLPWSLHHLPGSLPWSLSITSLVHYHGVSPSPPWFTTMEAPELLVLPVREQLGAKAIAL